jgi:hypothetical protein
MTCQLCGVEAATKYVEFYQNIGALILRFQKEIKGEFCKNCIHEQFWIFTLVNVILGWWGIVSLIVTPFFILNNVIRYLCCLSMPAVKTTAPAPRLTDEVVHKLQPYVNEIIDRLNAKETLDQIALDLAPRTSVTPEQVKLYIFALAQAANQQA